MAPATKKTAAAKADVDKTSPLRNRDRDWGQYSHIPPSQGQLAKNGRQKGRNLITWNRPRMYEKLLLHIQYECARHRVEVPWDHIAHRLNPGSSGNAITQQLVRLRQTVAVEGHLVPPPLPKPGASKQDPKVRGFARKFIDGSGDAANTTTGPVGWNEPFEDRRRALPDAADYVDDEDEGVAASMAGDETLGSVDLDDADADAETGDLVKSGGAKGKAKGKRPIKRQSSEDGDGSYEGSKKKKAKTSAQPPRAVAAKKGFSLKPDDSSLEASDDGKENDDGTTETTKQDQGRKEGGTPADVSPPPARPATAATQTMTRAPFSDPFAYVCPFPPGMSRPAARAHMPPLGMSATPFQQQMQPSPAYSPLSDHHPRGGVTTTPPPTRSHSATLPATLMSSADCLTTRHQGWAVATANRGNRTPMRRSILTTTSPSPGNFDVEHSTPRTAAIMRTHLNDWNDDLPSVFTAVDQYEEQLQRSIEKRKRYA